MQMVKRSRMRKSKRKTIKYRDFLDDEEKMRDFKKLSKDDFLRSYSYLTEKEYDLTRKKINRMR